VLTNETDVINALSVNDTSQLKYHDRSENHDRKNAPGANVDF
jgi:hypothetical protein